MKSVSGHSKDVEVARLPEAANQERLAQCAVKRLSGWEMSNPDERLGAKSAQRTEID